MLEAIIKRLRFDKRGVSNVIVVMLSLVLVVIVVGNVVLWSYQMNQLDLERIQESVTVSNVTRVTRSSWFTAKNEYTISAGSRLSGSFTDTESLDSSYETFREEKTQVFNPSSYVPGESTTYVSGNILSLTSNDDAYMNFRSYPNYEVKYQESLEIGITTSTTYQDKVSMSFTPQVTADFAVVATAEVQGSSTNYQTKAQLIVGSATYQELKYRVKDITDWYPFCGLKRLRLDGGTSYSVKIQFCTSNVAGTAYIRNARIIIISLQSEYAESEGLSTTSSTSWQDKTTLSFTPPIDGDYLIVGSANYRGSNTNYYTKIQLIQDDMIVHVDTVGRPGADTTASYYTFGVMRKVNLNASQHNFKIQYCASAPPAIAGINYAHLLAIKLTQFDNNSYAESEAESIPAASNAWYDKVANTYTADASSYLMIGSISYKSGSTSYSVGLDFQTESVSRQSPLAELRDATTYESAFFMTSQTLGAGIKTDKIRWMGESTSARVKSARLISCKLPILTQTAEVEFTGNSNTQNWTQLEWTIDSSFTTADVATTFQLYNFQTSQYPSGGDGYMSDTIGLADMTRNQTITSSPADFRDFGGNWKVRIRGIKATDTQFELKADWIEFKPTTSDIYRLDISNSFSIDLSTYPLGYIHGIEISIRYNATENAEKWFLKAYNWTASSFSDAGFNNTQGNQPVLNAWNDYAINVTDRWANYVSNNGTILLRFLDEGLSMNQTVAEVDFLAVRAIIDGARFDLRNSSPLTTHIVAIWIANSTNHQRYEANLFINSGEAAIYVRSDLKLPADDFITKVVTERGNISVFP
jgi:hypothetical protein